MPLWTQSLEYGGSWPPVREWKEIAGKAVTFEMLDYADLNGDSPSLPLEAPQPLLRGKGLGGPGELAHQPF